MKKTIERIFMIIILIIALFGSYFFVKVQANIDRQIRDNRGYYVNRGEKVPLGFPGEKF